MIADHVVCRVSAPRMELSRPTGRRPQYLIRDRDRVYGGDFVPRLKAMGIDTLLTPFRVPTANAIAERVVRTLRTECLDHVLILDERHLRAVLQKYVAYYNTERPHRSLALEPPVPVGAAQRRVARSGRGPCWVASTTSTTAPRDADDDLAPYTTLGPDP